MKAMKRTSRVARRGKVTPRLIAAYRRLMELEALDLPDDDPRRMAWGEHDMLRYEVHKACGVKPWHGGDPDDPEAKRAAAMLDELERLAGTPTGTQDRD